MEGSPDEGPREIVPKKAPPAIQAPTPPPAKKPSVALQGSVPQAKEIVPKKAPPPPQFRPEPHMVGPPPAKMPRVEGNLASSSSTLPPAKPGG
eukprot:41684-Pyramimonas_sp.AAC.1